MLLTINKERKNIILRSSICVGVLLMIGTVFTNSYEHDPDSYVELSHFKMPLVGITFVIMIGSAGILMAPFDFTHENLKAIMTFACLCAGMFTILVLLISLTDLPFYNDCMAVVNVDDITMKECMGIVEMGNIYTGQEIIDMVKENKIQEQSKEEIYKNSVLTTVLEP